MGETLTQWSIRIALLLYFGGMAARLSQRRDISRWLWVTAAGVYLAHVYCAFAFHHAWRHALAYEHVARRTQEVFGWYWGGGVYVNYAFTLLWVMDAAWWAVAPGSYVRRPRLVDACVHAVFVFIIVNAAIVFESGLIRYLSIAGFTLLLLVYLCRFTPSNAD